MNETMLSFDKVSFGYEAKKPPVLASLDLELKAGKVTAILGPNGAGKTTLLHLALGWLEPWQGTIRLGNKSLAGYSRQELGCLMALVPQSEYVPFEYSVLEYVLLGRAPHLSSLAMPGKNDYDIALAALEKVGIGKLYNQSILALSGGEHQLLLIARALTQQPWLLLMDEPTSHLDLHNKFHLVRIIQELSAQGVTIFMTNHEPEVVFAVADEVVLMKKGRVVAHGPVDVTLTSESLSHVYGIPVRVVSLEGRKQVLWV